MMNVEFAREIAKEYKGSLLKDLIMVYVKPTLGSLTKVGKKHNLRPDRISPLFKNCFGIGFRDRWHQKGRIKNINHHRKFRHKLVKKYGKGILKDLAMLCKNVDYDLWHVANKYALTNERIRQIFNKLYKNRINYIEVRKKLHLERIKLPKYRKHLLAILKRRINYQIGISFSNWVIKYLTIDEKPIKGDYGLLMVKCTYCGRYFYPCYSEVLSRYQVLQGQLGGEARLYCSDNCKQACPTFNRQMYPLGFKEASSREVQPELRQMRLEVDNYTCQKCGKTIEEIELHCHHIIGIHYEPIESADIDMCVTLCIDCHKWVHQNVPGCSYSDLRCIPEMLQEAVIY